MRENKLEEKNKHTTPTHTYCKHSKPPPPHPPLALLLIQISRTLFPLSQPGKCPTQPLQDFNKFQRRTFRWCRPRSDARMQLKLSNRKVLFKMLGLTNVSDYSKLYQVSWPLNKILDHYFVYFTSLSLQLNMLTKHQAL